MGSWLRSEQGAGGEDEWDEAGSRAPIVDVRGRREGRGRRHQELQKGGTGQGKGTGESTACPQESREGGRCWLRVLEERKMG